MAHDLPVGTVTLARGRERAVMSGYLWVFAGEVEKVHGSPAAGDLVDVRTHGGQFCGRGFFNPHSKIRIRLLTRQELPIDDAFWSVQFRRALDLRARVVADSDACRLVHAEGDLLPGLIVDRYGDVLVMQTLSFGMDRQKDLLAELLTAMTGAKRVYLRNDSKSRPLEGLPVTKGFLRGTGETRVEIQETGATFVIDVERGQKTGWYCDQRENRLATAALAAGSEVLEVFCHTGAFGIHAARRGAKGVLGLDSSAEALALARRHAELNDVGDRCTYREADAFDELRRLQATDARYDVVILDPPAFARSKQAIPHAVAGYKDLNLHAMRLLRPNGVLVSCSCSQPVSDAQFGDMLLQAARDARRQIRLIEVRGQGRDHPALVAMPETRYLKCFIVQVI